MYLEIEEKLLKKVTEITITDYEIKGNMLPCESIIPMIEDLVMSVEHYKEELEDIKNDLLNNYTRNQENYED